MVTKYAGEMKFGYFVCALNSAQQFTSGYASAYSAI